MVDVQTSVNREIYRSAQFTRFKQVYIFIDSQIHIHTNIYLLRIHCCLPNTQRTRSNYMQYIIVRYDNQISEYYSLTHIHTLTTSKTMCGPFLCVCHFYVQDSYSHTRVREIEFKMQILFVHLVNLEVDSLRGVIRYEMEQHHLFPLITKNRGVPMYLTTLNCTHFEPRTFDNNNVFENPYFYDRSQTS